MTKPELEKEVDRLEHEVYELQLALEAAETRANIAETLKEGAVAVYKQVESLAVKLAHGRRD